MSSPTERPTVIVVKRTGQVIVTGVRIQQNTGVVQFDTDLVLLYQIAKL